ncbi:MAG: rhodanese-related sulfurtransferase [Myxococcota bacterium]|jgi:rhodanese-related sulfurtransferase
MRQLLPGSMTTSRVGSHIDVTPRLPYNSGLMSDQRITPEQASQRLDSEPKTTYLDVRSVREFAAGHPPGAVNIPLADHNPFGMMAPNPGFLAAVQATFATDASLICGCAAGGRSLKAAQMLAASGYTNTVDMLGGFSGSRNPPVTGWATAGYPVATDGKTWADVQSELD